MESHDLPGRARGFTVSIAVTLTVNVDMPVTARSEDDARNEQFGTTDLKYAVAERVSRDGVYAIDADEWLSSLVEPNEPARPD